MTCKGFGLKSLKSANNNCIIYFVELCNIIQNVSNNVQTQKNPQSLLEVTLCFIRSPVTRLD